MPDQHPTSSPTPEIVCVHLLNDYSGSPLVLSGVVRYLVAQGARVHLHTARGGSGFLSGLTGVQYHLFPYRFFEHKIARLFALLWSQLVLFVQIWQYRKRPVVIYINTLLPFGAALAGWLSGKKVVYHLHETTVNPPVLKTFLKAVARHCAAQAIYVSKFLQDREPLPGVAGTVVYNALLQDFVEKAHPNGHSTKQEFTVLMLCSLKAYKGVDVFVQVARALPAYRFVLVLNSNMKQISQYFAGQRLPDNLVLFPAQKDVHSFYQQAHLVLNLSHPEQWVETFGMTLLEAMQYGLPVIAPPVGGPAELVTDDYNGYQMDQRNAAAIIEKIRLLATDQALYQRLAANAAVFARQFSAAEQGRRIAECLV